MTDAIVRIPDGDLTSTYADIIRKYEDELTSDQLLSLPYVIYGVSMEKTAELLKIEKRSLSSWARGNESYRAALSEMTAAMSEFHYSVLNQLAVRAWDVLAKSLEDDSSYPPAERLKTARFIIEQLGLKTNKTEVKHTIEEAPQVNVSEGSVDVIAQRLHQLMNGVSPVAEVIDGEYRTIGLEPMVACHPETTFGVLNTNGEGYLQCHVCGKWYEDLKIHIEGVHDLTQLSYRSKYLIDDKTWMGSARAKND